MLARAEVACSDYFRYNYAPLAENMSREERRWAEIKNLEHQLALNTSDYTLNDLKQLRRAEKWLHGRGTYEQNQKIKAYKEAAEADVYAKSLEIMNTKYKTEMPREHWDFIMGALKWFSENGPLETFHTLKSEFYKGQYYYLLSVDALLKKTDSKINKFDIRTLFKVLDAAQKIKDSDLQNRIETKLSAVNGITLQEVFKYFELSNSAKHSLKHMSGTPVQLEIYHQLLVIEQDYVNSGIILTHSSAASVKGKRVRKFAFGSSQYRIVYSRSSENVKIEVDFIGSHEEYNAFF